MESIADPVVDVVESLGEAGVGALIALETVLPPIPSEVILPFAGFAAAQGRLSLPLVWACATAGSLLGAAVLYWVGAALSYERLYALAGRPWFVLFGQRDLERGFGFFDRHGSVVVLLGRFVPFVRSVVSVPAGMDRMPVPRFLALTALGSGLWNAAFIALGYRLGEDYEVVQEYVSPVSRGVVVLGVLLLGVLAVRRLRQRRRGRADGEGQPSSRQDRHSAA
ncbi:DedA family protein [Phycicoccus endophyticus]|uniref:DedA family protein n=1 Tax=Phycicoccus endophyticus TaxID=1690220 RepID=A0A7G9R2M3_9MICO|nr:DedA family protein [Phycicoccus endophyticus]NHI20688.1 DedA family protein [Phycicoccus endophyticus]QNN49848.1 DedA family protein [Phycicoccus endophyticus]GGL35722.1 alkaline phosphatase [Phycicoccus endophyticus]